MTFRVSPPSPAQSVMRCRSSAGRPRSIGMSKIRELFGAWPSMAGAVAMPGAMLRARPPVASPSVLVALDARDAHRPPLRGWGRYALELERALPATVELEALRDGGWVG